MQLSKSISHSLSRSLARGISGGGGCCPLAAVLTASGTGAGVATLRMSAITETTLTLTGSGRFYSDAAGTLNESATWTIIPGALRTIYLRQATGISSLIIPRPDYIFNFGMWTISGWEAGLNSPYLSIQIDKFTHLDTLRIVGNSYLTGGTSNTLRHFWLDGTNVNWTYTGALSPNLVYFRLYQGNLTWTYTGALPVGLSYLYLYSNNIAWTYTGALPSNCSFILLYGTGISWTYSGLLPIGAEQITLSGININYTGLNLDGTIDIKYLSLQNFRQVKLTSPEIVTMLTSLTNRVGALPATITINDYADYANPPQSVLDAVALLKSTKSVTTVLLGA